MDESMVLLHRHELGYMFSSPTCSGHPGDSRLDIMLRPDPTNNHFDPKRVFFLVSDKEIIEHLIITYVGIQQKKYRVVAGPIRIQDRNGKVKFAFSFGGELQIEVEEQEKICTIISTAPIFEFSHPSVIQFVEEIEIILAERRAHWENNPHEFESRLTKIDPLIFYSASLKYLINQFDHSQDNNTQNLVHFMKTELRATQKEHALLQFASPLKELL